MLLLSFDHAGVTQLFIAEQPQLDFWVFVIRCNALDAMKRKGVRGATCLGTLSYIATPRGGNRRNGGHDINWFVNHAGKLFIFEPAEGMLVDLRPEEILSVWEGEAR